MILLTITRTALTTLALAAATFAVATFGVGSTSAQTQPDNTAVNRSAGTTADNQKMTAGDRDTAGKIRKAITGDKSLSTYAHNVKIICQNGSITLKGPVRSDDEVQSIVSKATDVAGASYKVVNQLSVKAGSK